LASAPALSQPRRPVNDKRLMSTLMKRDSENLAPNATMPNAVQQKSQNVALTRYHELIAAWTAGRFNMPDTVDAAVAEFYASDVAFDVETANGHTGMQEFKAYTFDTIKDWFAWVGKYDISDVTASAVTNSQDPAEIWQRFSCETTSKETAKSMLIEAIFIYNFEGDKIKRVSGIYADPDRVASLGNKNDDLPAQLTRPSFEPHPDPKTIFEAVFAVWGAGEFAAEQTKQAAMDKHIRPDVVIDVSSSLLPDVFKVYHGHAGTDAWANGVMGQWEFSRFDSTVEAGLKPGCVMQKLDVDAKHKGTGKEAKGIQIFNELAYDADGKAVYTKQFWANPALAASLY